MLKHLLIFGLFFLSFVNTPAKAQENGPELLRAMHSRYYKKICRTYTFSQKNIHYQSDTVSGRSEWHEAVAFPDKFKIVFGDKAKGNYVNFRNDSVYSYRKNSLVKAGADTNTLLLLLGGMYYRELDEVTKRLKEADYDLSKFSKQEWNGKPVFVLGAEENNMLANQVWVDSKTLTIVRIIEKMNKTDWMDMRFESHQKLCDGYVETKVSFRRNGILEQVEEYYDIKKTDKFPE